MTDTIECELCGEPGYIDDFTILLEIAAGTGELVEADFGCPNCGQIFRAAQSFHDIGYRVTLSAFRAARCS